MKNDRDDEAGTGPLVSRRNFLGGAGTTLALASVISTGTLSPASAATVPERATYNTGAGIALDGAYLGSLVQAEGGDPVIELPEGHGTLGSTASPTLRHAPLGITMGPPRSSKMYDWIIESMTATSLAPGRKAEIFFWDTVTLKSTSRLQMNGARLTEVTLPAGDATSDRLAWLSLKVQAESSARGIAPFAPPVDNSLPSGSRQMFEYRFRFEIPGLESAAAQIRKVGPVTIQLRSDGQWSVRPFRIEVPAFAANAFYLWLDQTLRGRVGERPATLRMMNIDLSSSLVIASFPSLGISRVITPHPGSADASATRGDVLVDLYARGVRLDLSGLAPS